MVSRRPNGKMQLRLAFIKSQVAKQTDGDMGRSLRPRSSEQVPATKNVRNAMRSLRVLHEIRSHALQEAADRAMAAGPRTAAEQQAAKEENAKSALDLMRSVPEGTKALPGPGHWHVAHLSSSRSNCSCFVHSKHFEPLFGLGSAAKWPRCRRRRRRRLARRLQPLSAARSHAQSSQPMPSRCRQKAPPSPLPDQFSLADPRRTPAAANRLLLVARRVLQRRHIACVGRSGANAHKRSPTLTNAHSSVPC